MSSSGRSSGRRARSARPWSRRSSPRSPRTSPNSPGLAARAVRAHGALRSAAGGTPHARRVPRDRRSRRRPRRQRRAPVRDETARRPRRRSRALPEPRDARRGNTGHRRRVRLSELSRAEIDPAAMESALDAYGRHRLLTFDRDPATREPTVEVAHEALLGAWDRLRGWIDEARDDIRVRNTLASAAADWEAAARDESFLLRGARLERVASWAETTTVSPSTREAAYLRASVERRDQERRTRRPGRAMSERWSNGRSAASVGSSQPSRWPPSWRASSRRSPSTSGARLADRPASPPFASSRPRPP